jgi:hypothetical protein
MYCSLGQNQFFDDAGAPLSAGRVKIYAKGSDTLLPIYEDSGDGFVPAQNPVITANDGRIQTIFWPAALVDVVVEKSNGDGTYTELDSYVAGLDMTSVEAVQGVGSILELQSIMPSENMVVQVNGYYTAGDSPTRKYLWVAGAANMEDGGYVIRSNRDYNGGRWVMLWDDPEFLPVSLYGVMCGYSGYAKTSNIPALESLGHYVIVGSVRVEVPPVILFDWRMAQPTSGQSSPVAYYWSGTFTTTHYVACARGVTFSISTHPTIHCAGVRGESYANAYWLVDQDYTTKDPAEKISTLMFNGNTQAMHDAFMACSACSKVKVLELFDGALYPTLTNTDTFSGKFIIDHASNEQSPAYSATASIVYMAKNGHVSLHGRFTASYIESLGALRANGTLAVVGLSFLTGGMSSPKGTFGGGNTQGGSDVSLDVGKLAKFLHTEFHAPMRLQYNGSQEAPGRTPVVQVTSGPTFDLTVPPFSGYMDGECLRIVNMTGNAIIINGTEASDSIPPYRFGDAFRWNGSWYMER